ncbi:hypothetical protein CY34DRAFT_797147 [Suillus luteus UH-Slu-Lm8-n1]|uniref:Unplaced genomic scaffold CY34scaffold_2, whole genome shotgun sequence n=1 Tax=Suillus luteus UH-Slu-Lm8-n1 TaxID=930992 RepID=A0A0D0BUJ4_9AGAM|nr:hypothetical protein CY34DRAFT_797147 [Suillus luteus UH-Slu-Lm8-n1]
MSDAEYEVESVTKARVDAKRGKKIIWKYHVKWKGYSWDDCTWEPERSFTYGSKHFLRTFWAHALTRGREHTNPQLFEKGEEIHVSGFPGASPHLESQSSKDNLQGPSETLKDDVSDDEPLTTKKRRRNQKPAGEPRAKRKRESEPGTAGNASTQRMRAFGPKSKARSSPLARQRRASSPGPRGARQLSLTKLTDTDAEGELDMELFGEVEEVEGELMQISPDDPDARDIPNSHADPPEVNGTIVQFDDLRSYSPDIQDTIEVRHVLTENVVLSADEGRSSPDPLFDSPSHSRNGEGPRSPAEPAVPAHRTRAANPLVKFIDAPLMGKNSGAAIPAKTRLISGQPSTSLKNNGSQASHKTRSKPAPGGRSGGKNRSSLLTAVKGGLTSVKGRFGRANDVREEPQPIEDAPAPSHFPEHEFAITSWSDEDAAGETDHEHQATASLADQLEPLSTRAPAPLPVPSGQELLEIAGLKPDADALPDFEDEPNVEHPPQPTNVISVETLADDVPTADAASPATLTVEDEAARKSLAEAKEQLFPSVQASASVTSISSSSWKTSKDNTIFGPMYKLQEPAQGPNGVNESVPTFKLILNVDAPVPLVLKDFNNMKGVSFTDIYADKSLDGRAGTFYLLEDAVRIVSTFSSLGSARVVPDSSANDSHKTQFDVFQQRLHSGQTFVTKAGKELLVFFSSQNTEISAKLSPPQVLIGLANTVLLMRVQIIDSTGYANAVMQITGV